ncbi:hypothetical protein ACF0H5_018717 [Mactra antiquata]
MNAKQEKRVLELPLSVIRPDERLGAVSPVFTVIVTDHSNEEQGHGKKSDKKKHRIWSKSSKSHEGCDAQRKH